MSNVINKCLQCGRALPRGANFCIKCGALQHSQNRSKSILAPKGSIVLNKVKPLESNRNKYMLWIVLVFLAGGWMYMSMSDTPNPIIDEQPVVAGITEYPDSPQSMSRISSTIANGKISVPLSEVKKNKFVQFEYTTESASVPLLAYISGEGKLVTAVRMCEPCNSKEFHIQNDRIICNVCGTTWHLDNLNAISGSCGKYPPDLIPSVVEDSSIYINESLVANWRRRI